MVKDITYDYESSCQFCKDWEERYRNVLGVYQKLKEELAIKHPSIHRMPEYMKPKDLVALGFYQSVDAIYRARRKNKGLPFVKVGKSIFYPKNVIIKFIEESLEESVRSKGS